MNRLISSIRIPPAIYRILALSTGYFVAACVGIALTREAASVAALWPANALLLGVLLRAHRSNYIGYFVGCSAGNFLASTVFNDSIPVATGFVMSNMLEILVALVLLRRILPDGRWYFSGRNVLAFGVVAGVIAPTFGALLGGTLLVVVYGSNFNEVFETWFLADAMGFLLITPAILAWDQSAVVRTVKENCVEAIAIGIVTVAVTIYALSQPNFVLLYAVIPLLLWAAFRLDTFGTAVASLMVCGIAIGTTAYGLGPISELATEYVHEQVHFLQMFLGVAVLVPLVVAMIIEERQQLIDELERKNAELERYTYTVSHDLKGPLITIQGFLGHLRTDLEAECHREVEEDIAEIEKASDSMAELLSDLLELSKQGVIANSNGSFPMVEIINNALKTLPYSAAVSFKAPLESPYVRGDRDRVSIVLRNILDNAQKFSSLERCPKVEITLERRDKDVLCRVTDNGIGIPQEHCERVFEVFERLNPRVPGTGVGLAIIKRIVEAHGGMVWIESKGANRGTTVCFTLPRETRGIVVQSQNNGQSHALHTAG